MDAADMAETPNMSLCLPGDAAGLALAHAALAAAAGTLGLDALDTDDVLTAAGEACKNVVYHAYEGQEGALELELYSLPSAIEVVVRDHGIGIRPHVGERTSPHDGIGLPMIHSLSRRVTYTNLHGGGTELRMHFEMPSAVALDRPAGARQAGAGGELRLPAAATLLELSPGPLARAVLPAVLGAAAAGASFPPQRLSGVRRLAGALATASERLRVLVRPGPGGLGLKIGPLPAGGARELLDACEAVLGPELTQLAECPPASELQAAETLELRLLDGATSGPEPAGASGAAG